MQKNLFHLSFDYWEVFLLFIIPALTDISIFIYAFFFLPQNKRNKAFSAFVLLLGIAQALDGIMRLSNTAETAMEWSRISAAPWVFITSFGLLFALRYTKWDRKFSNNLILTFLFLPSILLEFGIIGGLYEVSVEKSELWHWIANPKSTTATNMIYMWNTVTSLVTFVLFWLYYFKVRKDENRRDFSLLIAAGNTIPFVTGITSEVVFPLVLGIEDFPISTPAITIFSVSILIAIVKYKAFDYSPKHQWKNILETMNEGVLIVNNQDQIMYANKAFCEQTGYEFGELKGVIARNLLTDEIESKKKVEQVIKEREDKKSSQYEILIKTKRGQKIWTLISGSPYLDIHGNVIGSIGIHTNISELKLANNELKLFIYKASHDLRGPLASILGLTDLIHHENDKEKIKNYSAMIDYSAKKLDTVLINLAKNMQIKEIDRFDDEINFGELINETLKRFVGYEGFQYISITKEIMLEELFFSNKLIMESVFQNIIENAIKYRDLSFANPWLKISISKIENRIQIVFLDNGIGIEPSFQNRVFEMYFRGTETSKGSGLGLYLVKTAIDKLGGTIEVESKKNNGTKFLISLPVVKSKVI
ncbi:MAG TPA: ATP-binding protein [Bacteroidia bacterium]|jgi:PAS domain S-box-containing protein|nr:ATP-binding protein [Bacteroidia bacterium]